MKTATIVLLFVALLGVISVYVFNSSADSYNKRMRDRLSQVINESRSGSTDEKGFSISIQHSKSWANDFVLTKSEAGEPQTIGFTLQPLGPFYLYDFTTSSFRYEE